MMEQWTVEGFDDVCYCEQLSTTYRIQRHYKDSNTRCYQVVEIHDAAESGVLHLGEYKTRGSAKVFVHELITDNL